MNEIVELLPTLAEQTAIMLGIVAVSLAFGGIGGLIIGTGLYVTRTGGVLEQRAVWWILNVLVNTVRPIPFIILLAAVQPLGRIVVGTGIGTAYAVFAISLAATFGIARIVEQNLVTIPIGVIEAARATGASPWRIIRTVILPEALGPLVLGFTFAVISIVDMSAVAGLVGGQGLGNWAVTYGYRQFDELVTWSALIVVVIVVQLIQALGNALARRIMRR
ncbi:methionine ABC transporter permease [Agrococcus citreus]|uniref:ABC transporter permease n=1 Tax=Agrococcus citreus TaxID=84643 RepID=A0ABN1Z0N8_9MICO